MAKPKEPTPGPQFNVFLSWAGPRSKQVAQAFRDWLPSVLQSAKPWMSVTDIEKGTVWGTELGRALAECKVGVVFLTHDNLDSRWMNFEAGAVAKTVSGQTRACTVLLDGLAPAKVQGPLSQFEHTTPTKDEMKALILHLAKAIGADIQPNSLTATFEGLWAGLEPTLLAKPSTAAERQPDQNEMLAELVETTREIQRNLASLAPDPSLVNKWDLYSRLLRHDSPGQLETMFRSRSTNNMQSALAALGVDPLARDEKDEE